MAIKFKVAKDKILDGLQRVQNVVSTRTTLPILSNVLVRAESGSVSLTTTDLDVGVRSSVEAEVVKAGAATLPARRLFLILKEVPAAEVEIEIDDKNAASISCGASFYKVMGLPAEEFPPFPKGDGAKKLSLAQPLLRDLLRKTAYAVSTDETRYVLNGVYLNFKADKLTIVATDGRRLALIEHDTQVPKAAECEFILPTKAVAELQHLLADKGDLKLAVGENQLIADLGETTLVSKLIEGTYPNFRQVVPTETKERITLERELLLAALHRTSIMASEKSQSVKFSFSKNTLTLTANTPDVGEAKETLSVNYKGKELSVAFNPQYVMDPLRNLDSDEIFLELTDELSPGVIKVSEPFLYVVMPMRLS